MQMLCRNRVADFETWKAVFDSHAGAHQTAGLKLVRFWRSVEDPNEVFFLFDVESLEKAQQFISAPEAEEAGREAGVVEGECHFLEPIRGH